RQGRAEQVARPLAKQVLQLLSVEVEAPRLTHARRYAAEEIVDQRAQRVLDVAIVEIGPDEADAAVDVVSDSARGDDAALVRIRSTDAANAEAVAPVDIGHGQAGVLDAGQRGHVGHLLGRLVLLYLWDQLIVGENQSVDAHAIFVALRNPPTRGVDSLQRPAEDILGHDDLSHL